MAFEDWAWVFSYAGLVFAVVYRIPQIIKLVQTRSGGDISAATFLIHNGAYFSFIIYLWGSGKNEPVLLIYYLSGIFQNLLIFFLKRKYAKEDAARAAIPEAELQPLQEQEHIDISVADAAASFRSGTGGMFATEETLSTYAERRRYFHEQSQSTLAQRIRGGDDGGVKCHRRAHWSAGRRPAEVAQGGPGGGSRDLWNRLAHLL